MLFAERMWLKLLEWEDAGTMRRDFLTEGGC